MWSLPFTSGAGHHANVKTRFHAITRANLSEWVWVSLALHGRRLKIPSFFRNEAFSTRSHALKRISEIIAKIRADFQRPRSNYILGNSQISRS